MTEETTTIAGDTIWLNGLRFKVEANYTSTGELHLIPDYPWHSDRALRVGTIVKIAEKPYKVQVSGRDSVVLELKGVQAATFREKIDRLRKL